MGEQSVHTDNTIEVFEICNPSDPYTIKGKKEACHAAMLVLNPRYGLTYESGVGVEDSMFFFGIDDETADKVWTKHYGHTLTEYFESPANRLEVANALDSVLIGSFRDRLEVESTLAVLSPEDHSEWLLKRHDLRRTSMNDIGREAWRYAAALRRKLESETPSEAKATEG